MEHCRLLKRSVSAVLRVTMNRFERSSNILRLSVLWVKKDPHDHHHHHRHHHHHKCHAAVARSTWFLCLTLLGVRCVLLARVMCRASLLHRIPVLSPTQRRHNGLAGLASEAPSALYQGSCEAKVRYSDSVRYCYLSYITDLCCASTLCGHVSSLVAVAILHTVRGKGVRATRLSEA